MGINRSAVRLSLYSKKLGVDFENTLTLGRLKYYGDSNLSKFSKFLDLNLFDPKKEYSESFFYSLGAQKITSLDFSDYENADIIHDLNTPFPDNFSNKYSVIMDSGTLEHVFNFPTAIKSCMKALKVGGHFIGITPSNNLMGHGFYQMSPELYYRIFSPENGFKVRKMYIAAADESESQDIIWYEVSDPKTVHSRVVLCNNKPAFILVIAEKTNDCSIFETVPQQSDYVETWNASKEANPSPVGSIKKLIPVSVKNKGKKLLKLINNKDLSTNDLGILNPNHYKEIDIEKVILS